MFSIQGVQRVFFGADFISVTKQEELPWSHLQKTVEKQIETFIDSGEPLFLRDLPSPEDDLKILKTDSEALQMIKEILSARVRPFV